MRKILLLFLLTLGFMFIGCEHITTISTTNDEYTTELSSTTEVITRTTTSSNTTTQASSTTTLQDEIIYETVSRSSLFNNGLLGVCHDERCGYYNNNFELVIPLMYHSIGIFNNRIAIVEDSGGFGVINVSNEIVIPLEYDNIIVLDEYGLLKMEKDGEYTYSDINGNELSYREAHLRQGFSEDTLFMYPRGPSPVTGQLSNEYGFKDIDGNIVISANYSRLTESYFTDSTIVSNGSYYISLSSDGTVSENLCREVSYGYFDGYFSMRTRNDYWGIIDKYGNIIVEPVYDYISRLNEFGFAIIQASDDLFGMIKYNGDIILDPTYDFSGGTTEARKFQEKGYAIFYNDTTSLLYNAEGELIFTSDLLIRYMFYDYVILWDKLTREYSICDLDGNIIVESFSDYSFLSDQRYISIDNWGDAGIVSEVYNHDMEFIGLDFDFNIGNTNYGENKTEIDYLYVKDMTTEAIYLYSNDYSLITSFDKDDFAIQIPGFSIYSDGYITYYDSDFVYHVMNLDAEVLFVSEPLYFYQEYEAPWLWTH